MKEKVYINIEKSGGHYLVQFNATDTPIVAKTLSDVGGIVGKYISEQFGEKGQATSKQKASFLAGLLTSGKFPAWEKEIHEKLIVEVNMSERMTRKELTEKVRELEARNFNKSQAISNLHKELQNRVEFDVFESLLDFLNLEREYVCGTDGYFKFRRKQSARATKKQTKEKK